MAHADRLPRHYHFVIGCYLLLWLLFLMNAQSPESWRVFPASNPLVGCSEYPASIQRDPEHQLFY